MTAIGLELMRDRATTEAEARLTGGLFQTLLAGDELDDATIARRASYLGYDLTGPNAVIAIRSSDGSSAWLDACVRRSARRREAPTAIFERDDIVFVVLSGVDADAAGLKAHGQLIEQEVEVAGRAGRVRIAFAGPHHGIGGIRTAVREAAYTLQVQDIIGGRTATAFAELGVWTLLGRIGNRDELAAFATDVLGALIAHDAEHHADLVQTLRELVRHNYHYRSAAEALYAHPNTLRYRMTRVTEMTGLDLTSADDRLRVELSLRILDVVGNAA